MRILMNAGFQRALLFGAILATSLSLQAELPPPVYKERQDNAPEALMIMVRSVSQRETAGEKWTQIEFTVQAEVQKVERSASQLVPGTTIEIKYSQRHYFRPIVGPSEVPALEEGRLCPAYLSRDGKFYSPAAGGFSFETVR